ncbi:MAG: 4Fe-4S binding protein [Bacteroidales bacterium]
MKLKQIITIGIIVAVVSIFTFRRENQGIEPKEQAVETAPTVNESILSLFPDTKELIETDKGVYKAVSENDSIKGYIVYTAPFTNKILGYGGPTPLQIAMDTDRKIINVSILPENDETPSYIKRVKRKGIFESWNNLSVADALEKKVEVVSGATMSSDAIIETMQHRLAMVNNSSFEKPFNWMKLLSDAAVIVVLILALFSFYAPQKTKNLRLLLLSLSTLILGFWQGKMLSLASDYNWIINGINWTASWTLILILGISIILPLISGKSFYCTYMCPYGALQELLGRITKRKVVVPEKLRVILLRLRPIYLILITGALLLKLPIDLANFEPFAAFAIQSAATSVLILAGFFLGLSVFISRPWCKYFCPTGTLMTQFNRKKK